MNSFSKLGVLQAANTVQAAHPDKPRPDVTALAQMRTEVAVIPTSTGNQLVSMSDPLPPGIYTFFVDS